MSRVSLCIDDLGVTDGSRELGSAPSPYQSCRVLADQVILAERGLPGLANGNIAASTWASFGRSIRYADVAG
jgi:hypothetical protein